MFGKFEFDLQRGGYVLVNDMLKIKPGETVVITADTASDMSVVSAAAGAVAAAEAKPLVMITPTPRGVGKAADPYLPVEALSGAVAAADVWVEFNGGWLLYSTVFENAMKNKKLRYLNLCEMDARMMYRCIAPVNQPVLAEFMSHLRKIFEGEHEVRVTNAAGTDLTFRTDPRNTISTDDGNSTNIGMNFLAGQFTIVPKFGSIEGALVFSGSLIPACGVLKEPVKLKVEHGRVTEISGGTQADEFRGWLAGFDDPNMYLLAHLSFGLNPGARYSGICLEDERIWGDTEWGIGYLSGADMPPDGIDAKSHVDGLCPRSSIWVDGEKILDAGDYVQPELARLSLILLGKSL